MANMFIVYEKNNGMYEDFAEWVAGMYPTLKEAKTKCRKFGRKRISSRIESVPMGDVPDVRKVWSYDWEKEKFSCCEENVTYRDV